MNIRRNRPGPFFFFSLGRLSFSETDVPVFDGALLAGLLGARLEDRGGALEDFLKKAEDALDFVSVSFFV